MRHRHLASLGALVLMLALISLAAVSMRGQTQAPKTAAATKPPATSKPGPAPKTAWGDPDLQGTWFVMESVPLERTAANANKQFLTDEEVAAADKQKAVDPGRNARSANRDQDVGGAYNAVFNSVLKTSKRTSMITDPPDGKIPPLTPEAQQRQARGGRGPANSNDNPETIAQSPRCLGVQMPFLPLNTLFAQGTVMQVVQGPKSMGIYMEDDHAGGGNRVIYMDGRPKPPAAVRSVLGESRGHWEGNTLVVETTNFSDKANFGIGFRGATPNTDTLRMIEKFTRIDSNNLRREITFEDPKTWTRPWTLMIEMGKTDDHRHMIFDSACHEGNYGLTGILVGSRREEQANKK
ncbi:MAG: hypothetical protein C5B56_06215 [Proteobacteria bacterium]|nr:MAG: hypothetical protein C5B56_06215 [Pseudomonadota bacterium]